MANSIDKETMPNDLRCPVCNGDVLRIMSFHWGATYQAECAYCGFGQAIGDDKDTAIARWRGKKLRYKADSADDKGV